MDPPFFHVFMLDDLFPSVEWWNSHQMNSRLWRHLPPELLVKVLLRLPAASQARFKAVCRTWKRLFSSPKFKKKSAAISFSSGLYICGLVHSDALKFEWPFMKELEIDHYKVHKLSLAGLPEGLCKFPNDEGYCGRTLKPNKGLILMGEVDYCNRRLGTEEKCQSVDAVVFNPLNQTWRKLPTLYAPRLTCPRLALFREGDGFNVYVGYETHKKNIVTGRFSWVFSNLSTEWQSSEMKWRSVDSSEQQDNDDDPGQKPTIASLPRFKLSKNYSTFVVRGETLLIPTWSNRCEVWGLHESKRHWVLLSFLPDDLMAKVRTSAEEDSDDDEDEPEAHRVVSDEGLSSPKTHQSVVTGSESERVDLVAFALVGDVLLFTLSSGEMAELRHVVAYHVVKRSWQLVLTHCPDQDEDGGYHSDFKPSWQRILLESTDGCRSGLGMSFLQMSSSVTL